MIAPENVEVVFFLFSACEITLPLACDKLKRTAATFPKAKIRIVSDGPGGRLMRLARIMAPACTWGGPKVSFNLATLTRDWAGKNVVVVRSDMLWGPRVPPAEDGGGFVWFLSTDEVYVTGCGFPSAYAFGEAPFRVPAVSAFNLLRKLPKTSGNVATPRTSLMRLSAVWDAKEEDRYRERVTSEKVSASVAAIETNKRGVVSTLRNFGPALKNRVITVCGWDGAAFKISFVAGEVA